MNRLLVHATSALQNGIQKMRSEGHLRPKPQTDLALNSAAPLSRAADEFCLVLIGQDFSNQKPVQLAVHELTSLRKRLVHSDQRSSCDIFKE